MTAYRVVAACFTLALVSLMVASCKYGRPAPATPVMLPTATPELTIVTVQRGTVVNQRTFPGKVVLSDREDLYFDIPGRIEMVYVDSGQEIEAGQLIADLHPGGLEFEVADARMAVDLAMERVSATEEDWTFTKQAADVELAIAQRTLETLQSMVNPDPLELFVSGQRVEQAQIEVDRLRRGVDPEPSIELQRAELALERALEAMAETQLVSPQAGRVLFLTDLEPGIAVSAYEPIVNLVDPDSTQIEANLVASDQASLYEGMPVTIAAQTGPDTALAGKIVSLPQPVGTGTGTTTLIDIASQGSSSEAALRPGATVEVTAVIEQVDGTLWIPVQALRGPARRPYVVVNEEDGVREVEVEIGVRGEDRVEVKQGLEEGQEVIQSQA